MRLFEGRLNRRPFISCSFVFSLILTLVPITLALMLNEPINKETLRVVQLFLLLVGCIIFPSLIKRRLNDRNRSSLVFYIFMIPCVINALIILIGAQGSDQLDIEIGPIRYQASDSEIISGLEIIGGLINFPIGIWMFIELSCLRGTVGPNQYGPDPLVGEDDMPRTDIGGLTNQQIIQALKLNPDEVKAYLKKEDD